MKFIHEPEPQYSRMCTSIPQCEPYIPERNFEDIDIVSKNVEKLKSKKIHIHSSDLDKMLCSLGLGTCTCSTSNCEQNYQIFIMLITCIVAIYLFYRK